MTENIFRNSRGTFTCDDCGQAATVPSLIKHEEGCEGVQMTEPAYSEEDLRRAEKVVRQADACSFDKRAAALILANNFASVRRERDEVAEKLAEALRKTIGWALLANDNDPWYFSEGREPSFEPDMESAKAALTAYERSRA